MEEEVRYKIFEYDYRKAQMSATSESKIPDAAQPRITIAGRPHLINAILSWCLKEMPQCYIEID